MKKLIAYIIVAIIGLIIVGSIFKGLDSAIRILNIVPWWAWFFITPFVIFTLFPDNKNK
jgi:hypothetical protein